MNEEQIRLYLFQTILPHSAGPLDAAGLTLDVLNVLFPDYVELADANE